MKISIQKKLNDIGISRYELAKRVGITYPTVDNIYKGNSTLEAICKELNCTPNDIFTSDDPHMQQLLSNQSIINKE